MTPSRTKPPRKDRSRRSTAAQSQASGDPIASAYAAAVARTILGAADSLATHAAGVGRRRLINHLRGNQLTGAPEDAPRPGFAVLESHLAGWVEEAVDRLSEEGLLTLTVLPTGGSLIGLSASGRQALEEEKSIPPDILPRRPRLGAHPGTEGPLRELRRRISAEEGRPPFSIFTNRVLAALAERRPGNLADLAEVPGLGAPRIGKYGRRILAALRKEKE
jgi:superfamily II DNA helicase RecQ